MSEQLPFSGLLALDAGEPLSTRGYYFVVTNPRIIDRLLKVGAITHRHDQHAAMADPTADPTVVVSATGGSIPAGTPLYLCYTLIDPDGGETLPSPVFEGATPSGYGAPTDAPTVTVAHTSGMLLANTYTYGVTVTDGAGGETVLSPVAPALVPPGYASSEVQISGLTALCNDASGSDPAAGWRLWRQVNGGPQYLIATGSASTDTFTDDGVAGDCSVSPPTEGTTAGTGSFTFTVPSAGQPASAVNFVVYGSIDGSFTSPSKLATYPVSDFDTDLSFTSLSLSPGQPPLVSSCIGGANQINPDTDILDWAWKRTVATVADLPATGNGDGDSRIVLADHDLYTWDESASEWVRKSGLPALTVTDGTNTEPDSTTIEFVGEGGATVTVDEASPGEARVTIDAGATTGITVSDGTTSEAGVTELVLAGSGGAEVAVSSTGSGEATVTVTAGGGGGSGGGSGASGDAARAYLSTGAPAIPSGSWVKVPLDTASFDPDANFDVTTNHRFVATEPGRYVVFGNVESSGSVEVWAGIFKNGAYCAGGSLGSFLSVVGDVVDLAAGDFLELWAYGAGGATTVNTGNGPGNNFLAVSPAGGARASAPGDWVDVTVFDNGWSNEGSGYVGARYMKDALGFVHVEGLLTGGASGSSPFTLPAGYRPGYRRYLPAAPQMGAGYVGSLDIQTNGIVTLSMTGGASVGFSDVFLAES